LNANQSKRGQATLPHHELISVEGLDFGRELFKKLPVFSIQSPFSVAAKRRVAVQISLEV
jgi:hypothetical protein